MSKEKEYHELYDRLMAEVAALHQSNRRRIRSGMRRLVVVTVGLMLLMFLAEGNKVFTLMLWIAAMFGVASYLIAVEYADYELQKKVEQITQMEQESLGALLELPELSSLPHVHGACPVCCATAGSRRAAANPPQTEEDAMSEPEKKAAAPAALGTSAPEEKAEYTVEKILRETIPGGAAQTPASAQVLERLLQDPDKLADDLLLLTKALQNLSDDLRRGSKADGKGRWTHEERMEHLPGRLASHHRQRGGGGGTAGPVLSALPVRLVQHPVQLGSLRRRAPPAGSTWRWPARPRAARCWACT